MARKATIKSEAPVVTSIDDVTEQVIEPETVNVTISEEAIKEKELPIVTKIIVLNTLKLDNDNEIIIEKSSDFWIHAHWSDKKMKAHLFSFEINHSTSEDDIIKSVRKFARDKFAYLAERTFVA